LKLCGLCAADFGSPVLDTSLTEKNILTNGLNYASGGGGILNETSTYFVSCKSHLLYFVSYIYHLSNTDIFWMIKLFLLQIEKLSLDKQIELFQGTQELIRSKIGKRAASKFS
jgi:hypothetical protein